MAKRECVACGKTPVTREHIIPQWASRHLGGIKDRPLRGTPHAMPRASQVTPGTIAIDVSFRGHEVPVQEITTRVLCRECNNNRFSQVEKTIKPILSGLIDGRQDALSPEDATLLAAWMTKTSIIYEFNDRRTMAVTAAQRADFFGSAEPPAGFALFACRYRGEHDIWLAHAGGRVTRHDSSRPPVRVGFTTLVLGKIVLGCMTSSDPMWTDEFASDESRAGVWSKLWPAPLTEIEIIGTVDDSDIRQFSSQPSYETGQRLMSS